MLHSRDLPLTLWAEAANTTMFVWNRTVNKQLTNVTPFEQLFKQVFDVSFLRAFGSDAYLHVPKKHRTKLDPKSQKLILVGYDQKGRAYRLWDLSTKRMCIGVDVIIHETLGFHTTDVSQPTKPQSDEINITIPPSHHNSVISVPTDNMPTSSDGPEASLPQLSDDSHHIQNDNVFSPIHSEHDAYSDTNEENEAIQEGEIVPVQGDLIPVQEDIFPGEQTAVVQGQDDTALTHVAAIQGEDNTNQGEVNQGEYHLQSDPSESEEDDLGIRLRPRSRQPPLRYGEWIQFDDNRINSGSVAFFAKRSKRNAEPKTYK